MAVCKTEKVNLIPKCKNDVRIQQSIFCTLQRKKLKTVFSLPYFLGNISVITLPVSSTNSPTKILPKTLGPINVNVGPQMVSFAMTERELM